MNANFYEPRYNKDGKILALADVDVAEGIIVKGFRVIRGQKGLFASVPTKSFAADGRRRFLPQVVFANPDLRARFLEGLLEAYRKWSENRTPGDAAAASQPPADELVE